MNHRTRLFLVVTLIFTLFIVAATPAMAQSDETAVSDEQPEEKEGRIITFEELGYNGAALQSPVDSTRIVLRLPSSWELTPESTISLDLIAFIARGGIVPTGDAYGGLLDVRVNNVPVSSTIISSGGERTLNFRLPAEILAERPDALQLTITLRTERNRCEDETDTYSTVFVQPSSTFNLDYNLIAPELDLANLPLPIQQASFLPDLATLVVPNDATEGELSAAMTVAAGLGRKTWRLEMDLLPESDITADLQSSRHLIFVGAQDRFSMLEDMTLPDASFDGEIATGDGLLQLVISPFSSGFVVLHVGGETEEGLLMAAQAVGASLIRTTDQANLAIVTEVSEEEDAPLQAIEQTLGDYGFDLIRFEGEGLDSISFEFFIPAGKTVADSEDLKAAFDLIFNHSATIDFERSSVNIIVNDEPIGSFRLDELSTIVTERQSFIPASSVQPGINQITLATEMFSATNCNLFSRFGAWTVIHPESTLSLPLVDLAVEEETAVLLSDFPNAFVASDDLSSLTIVLPEGDQLAWDIAARLSMMLGDTVGANVLQLNTIFDSSVADADADQNLLIIGQPTSLALIDDLNEALPAPFAADSNRVIDEQLQITYQVPANASVGYLQLAASPWNDSQTVLGIFGADEDGLLAAAETLLATGRRRQLNGDFAIIDGPQVFSVLVNEPEIVEEAVEEEEEAAVSEEEAVVIEEDAAVAETVVEETAVVEEVPPVDLAASVEDETEETTASAEQQQNISDMVSEAISPQVANASQVDAAPRTPPTAWGILILCAIVAAVIGLLRLRNMQQYR